MNVKIQPVYRDRLITRIIGKLQRSIGIGSGAFDCSNEVTAISFLFKKIGRESSVGMLILDVGGNLGDWTNEASKRWPDSQFIIFEPSATALMRLRDRFSNAQNIEIVAQAMSNKVGKAKLYSDIPGSGLGSLSQRDLAYLGIKFSHEETVQVNTLDNFLLGNNKSISILKIDVEGHELAVLLGATNLLASDRKPTLVQFEFGGACVDTRTYFRDLWKFFERYEYDLFRISKNKLHPILEYQEGLEIFKTTNIVAISRERKVFHKF
jgi:FkbM family methyltransferase